MEAVLDRAVTRGELPARPDPDLVHATLLGTVFTWLFVLGKRPDGDLPARIAALVASGL